MHMDQNKGQVMDRLIFTIILAACLTGTNENMTEAGKHVFTK